MKKLTLILSALVLFASMSFAQQNPDPAKNPKPTPAVKNTTKPVKAKTNAATTTQSGNKTATKGTPTPPATK